MTTSPDPIIADPHAADTPLHEITDELDREGHDGQFEALEGGDLACFTCGHRFPAAAQSADHVTRLEGDSDPGDLTIVVPVTCPDCGTSGALIARYGPEASRAEADVLVALPRDASRTGTGAAAPETADGASAAAAADLDE